MQEYYPQDDNGMDGTRRVSLELLAVLDGLCQEQAIPYTLYADSLWGLLRNGGFPPNQVTVTVALLYPDYTRFVDIFRRQYADSPVYALIDHEHGDQFDAVWSRLIRRSRVALPEDRRRDEEHYAFYLDLIPLFYAGDTETDLRRMTRVYRQYRNRLQARKPICRAGTYNLAKECRRLWRNMRNRYYSRLRRPDDYLELRDFLRQRREPSIYVFSPLAPDTRGVARLASTYMRLERHVFAGVPCSALAGAEKWLADFSPSLKLSIPPGVTAPADLSRVMGPEVLRRVQSVELGMLLEFDRVCRKHGLAYSLFAGTLLGAVRHKGFIPWDDDVDVIMPHAELLRFVEIAKREVDPSVYFVRTQENDLDNNLTYVQMRRNGTVYVKNRRREYDSHPGLFIDIFPIFPGSRWRFWHYLQTKVSRFYKTALWAHMGAEGEKSPLRQCYYNWLAKMPPKAAYARFMKCAAWFGPASDRFSHLADGNNPFNSAHTRGDFFENPLELEFEGRKFMASRHYHAHLTYLYGEDYHLYPPLSDRFPGHSPAVIDLGAVASPGEV